MPNGEGSLSSLRYQITCTQEGGKKLLNSTCQEKITSNFSKGKITSIFSKDRMGGWKRWSKPQVSPLREDSNIILSNTFIATERETSVSLEQILSRNCATWLKDYMECKAPHRWAWRPLILVFSTVTCKTEESVYSLLFYLVPDWKDYHKLRWVFRQSWETETVVQHR